MLNFGNFNSDGWPPEITFSDGQNLREIQFQIANFRLSGKRDQTRNLNLLIQGAPIKNNSLGKIHYLSYCNKFFHQIYSFYKGGFRPHTQQILGQYLLNLDQADVSSVVADTVRQTITG